VEGAKTRCDVHEMVLKVMFIGGAPNIPGITHLLHHENK